MSKKLRKAITAGEVENTMEKRDHWFNEYHDMPELGITATRKIYDRIAHYTQDDCKGGTAVELGCNMGQMSFQAEKWGADVIGVEFDSNVSMTLRLILYHAKYTKRILRSNISTSSSC